MATQGSACLIQRGMCVGGPLVERLRLGLVCVSFLKVVVRGKGWVIGNAIPAGVVELAYEIKQEDKDDECRYTNTHAYIHTETCT